MTNRRLLEARNDLNECAHTLREQSSQSMALFTAISVISRKSNHLDSASRYATIEHLAEIGALLADSGFSEAESYRSRKLSKQGKSQRAT